jgi:Tfp pilus assembly protein PilE
MGDNLALLIPIIAIIGVFGTKAFREVKDYLLKKEQIKADAELKAEALRLKNSLELEQFMSEQNNKTYSRTDEDISEDETQERRRNTRDNRTY